MKAVVFASGGGSNFKALLERKAAGDLQVDFCLLITNNSKAGATEHARAHGVKVLHLPPSRYSDPAEYTVALSDVLTSHGIELIVLAGYMKKLPDEIVQRFRYRIVNVHPALLPAFGGKGMYGHFVHEAVVAFGARVSGITVHFVDEEYDHGPVILQHAIPILSDDTPEDVAAKVLAVEHAHYWRAIDALAQGKITVVNNRVLGDA